MIDGEQKQRLLRQAETLCRERKATLLFLTLFGSTLYGTETPGKSDLDIRGIFLPSKESLALQSVPKSLHYATGDGERRNTAADVDIDLWSLQHWLLKLLPAGDTGALDLLFSPSHRACTLFQDSRMDAIFAAPLQFLDVKSGRAYAEYSLSQAKKYGIKGSRVGALKAVHNWLRENCAASASSARLRDVLDAVAGACADGKFCFLTAVQGEPALQLCGKIHAGGIRVTEFVRRVEADIQRYGARAAEAERNKGIDFKALSHALRALDQMEELLTTGAVMFPLKNRRELLEVKQGLFSWAELEPKILARLEEIDGLREKTEFGGCFDRQCAEQQILACYGFQPVQPPVAENKIFVTKNKNIFQPGFSIPRETLEAVQAKLDAVEKIHGVHILYACESGSRGWGFPSADSDFDVRFIYAHTPDWYLRVAPEEDSDVLELGIEDTPAGELDISGWELRKALKLFRRSNPPLLEWLSSPLVYRESGPLAFLLRAAAPAGFSPLGTWHHYRNLMEKSRTRQREKTPSVKARLYLLRSLLAMRWIESGKGVPPMRFDLLMDGVITDAALRSDIDAFVAAKKSGSEKDGLAPPPRVAAFIESEADRLKAEPPDLPAERCKADLDAVFRLALAQE